MTGSFHVNGTVVPIEFSGAATLLDVLRSAGFTEVKRGCEHGECGACIVLIDGAPVNACQVYAATAVGHAVTTTAGLGVGGQPHALHRAFARTGAVQCGFCTPGMVTTAYALLQETPSPTEEQVRQALAGNLCRCTGYVKPVEAVLAAAREVQP